MNETDVAFALAQGVELQDCRGYDPDADYCPACAAANAGADQGEEAARVRLIWTKRAIERWADGEADPMHTISAPNIADVYDGYVRQFKDGTPWALVAADDTIIATGTAGFSEVRI